MQVREESSSSSSHLWSVASSTVKVVASLSASADWRRRTPAISSEKSFILVLGFPSLSVPRLLLLDPGNGDRSRDVGLVLSSTFFLLVCAMTRKLESEEKLMM